MKLYNSYLGFTDQVKPMQAAKQEKSLDMFIRYNDQVMKEKEYVYTRLQEGFKPVIEENYQHYKKNGELTKPKTLYKLEKESGYCEINKTLYNFATYLLDNDFLNEEKAVEFMINEQQHKEETDRLKYAQEAKERQEREEKARVEREKEDAKRKIKIDNWTKKGNSILTNEVGKMIKETIQEHFRKFEVSATEEEKEFFVNDFMKTMPQKLGNMVFLKSNIEYYFGKKEEDKNYFHPMNIEGEIFMKLFNIEATDNVKTIEAKITSLYENREYKSATSKPVKKHEFYILNKSKEFELKTGEKKIFNGLVCFISQNENDYWVITEARTGMALTGSTNRNDAIVKAKNAIENQKERLEAIVKNTINKYGLSPLYKEETAV
ncbi:hypothetical protein EVU96_09160 [Bacillus infantis]|uniref:hypothetical protein n=1 Tax=Bacillus infantis TaxID=324767 RepID=UPI00101D29BC|nr:hypothetical protein [Bacillus infantis]RYI30573.1 hypothetical protein EVU96_09160 [Bacillus infantis]